MLTHFSIEYRKHFTKFHSTVVDTAGGIQIGATEEAMILMFLINWLPALIWGGNGPFADEIDLGFFSFTKGTALLFFTFYLSVQYNLGNFYAGFKETKNKMYAIACMTPFIMCYVKLIAAWYFSNLWNEYPILFIFYAGIHVSSKTA